MSLRTRLLVVLALCCSAWSAQAQRTVAEFGREPFQIFDNLYFIGTGEVCSYVLTTSDGSILIDTMYGGEFTPYLLDNMQQLGLDIADVEYILILQGHADHYGGARELQDNHTDAPIGAHEEDWKMIDADLGDGAPSPGFVIEDGDTLTLGDTTLRFEHTPGHTPGTTSIRLPVFDNGVRHEAYYHGGVPVRTDDPDVIRTAITNLERIKQIPGIEVSIANHFDANASTSPDLFERAALLENRQPGEPHPWVAPDEFQAFMDEAIAAEREKL